ncbi:MAG: MMPL family transporter [Planctomycetaceae bacterium]|nr:MMPL family transporter [Planctomycetaceae bacterium]
MRTLIQNRNLLLLVAVIAVLLSIPASEQLRFDQRIEAFFAEDNRDLQILSRSRREFGGDEFVVVAWTEDRLFEMPDDQYPQTLEEALAVDVLHRVDPPVAEKMRRVAAKLNAIAGVNGSQTQHLADFLDAAPKYKPSRRSMLRLFEGTMVGKDGRTTGIVLELLSEAQSVETRAATLKQIRVIAGELGEEVAVAGEPVQVFDMFEMVEQDGQTLFLVSLSILAVVLLLMFRGVRWVLSAVGLVLGSVVATRATLFLAGAELSMVSSMLSSLVTVIGIATCMHVFVHYREIRREQPPVPAETPEHAEQLATAARGTFRDLAGPVFWTCVTTAVGFGSLLVSQITPVRSFSVMMCLATGVVFVGCAVVLPATLASGSRLRPPALVPLEHWLDRGLHLTVRAVESRPVLTGLLCFGLFAAAIPGVLRLDMETDFSRNFRESSSIVQSLKFIESRLGGAGSWEIAFDTPEVLNDEFLESIEGLTAKLREMSDEDESINVLSLTDISDLPPRIFGPAKTLRRIANKQPELVGNFYNAEAQRMRIILRSAEQMSSEQKLAQIVGIRQCVSEFFQSLDLQQQDRPEATGMFVLLAELIQSLLSDQLKSFLVACGGILLCMTVAFRSLRIGILSLFPNVFPVAILMGALGWSGVKVNIGTAMITSVSMGLTVDSTIHYITAFERARRTHSVTDSLKRAHASAGRAVVFSHVALVAGFLVLTASRFIPLVYFGALLSLSMIGGVFGDLVLLPLLLRWTTPERKTAVSDLEGV